MIASMLLTSALALAGEPLDVNVSYKPGKGVKFATADGDFALAMGLRAQFRYELESEGSDLSQAFMVRRARVKFSGHMFGEHNEFAVELAVSPRDQSVANDVVRKTPLLTWYADFTHLRDLNVRIGDFKVPYSIERLVSSGNLELVDRSITNAEFTLDRDLGIELHSEDLFGLDGKLHYGLAYMAGEGRGTFAQSDLAPLVVARVEVHPLGSVSMHQADLARSETPLIRIAGAFGWLGQGKGSRGILGSVPADGGTTDTVNVTADATFLWHGLSTEAAFFWRDGTRNPGDLVDEQGDRIPAEDPRDGVGGYGQLGFVLPKIPVQLVGRFGHNEPLGTSSLSASSELGGGVSWYIADHAMKLQTDVFRNWAEQMSDGSTAWRLQLQASI